MPAVGADLDFHPPSAQLAEPGSIVACLLGRTESDFLAASDLRASVRVKDWLVIAAHCHRERGVFRLQRGIFCSCHGVCAYNSIFGLQRLDW